MATLSRGDKGDSVKELQRELNRVGSMLTIDGDYGPGTEAAVVDAREALGLSPGPNADDELQRRLAALAEPSPELTSAGVTFIGREEISSPAEYRRKFLHPVWPSAQSGITIGIGYDLRFANRAKLQADWSEALSDALLDRLAAVSGTVGSADKLDRVKDVTVPLPAAVRTFLKRMMPEHIGNTRQAFPQLDALPAARRTALISLVFNRGASLDPRDDRRLEMIAIRDLVKAGKFELVGQQFELMTRLWNPATEGGVIGRRRREALLWNDGFAALQLV